MTWNCRIGGFRKKAKQVAPARCSSPKAKPSRWLWKRLSHPSPSGRTTRCSVDKNDPPNLIKGYAPPFVERDVEKDSVGVVAVVPNNTLRTFLHAVRRALRPSQHSRGLQTYMVQILKGAEMVCSPFIDPSKLRVGPPLAA